MVAFSEDRHEKEEAIMNTIITTRTHRKILLSLGCLVLTVLVVLAGCNTLSPKPPPAPTEKPQVSIDTIDDACEIVEAYLIDLAKTPRALRTLAIYREMRWGTHNCVYVEDYAQNYKRVSDKEDLEGWDVKRYIIYHIFHDAIYPAIG